MTDPRWRGRADAWFKLLGAIAIGYLIIARIFEILARFIDVTMILVGAILLAYLVVPFVRWLNLRLPLWGALTITYVLGLIALAAVAYFFISPLTAQFENLTTGLPALQHELTARFTNPNNPLFASLPESVRSYLGKLPAQAIAALQQSFGSLTTRLTSVLLSVVSIAAIVVAIPVVSIYLLAESPMIKTYFIERIPGRNRDQARSVLADLDVVLGGFVRGQLIVAATVGILCAVGFVLVGLPYAFVIAAWVGLTDIIPYVGPFAGAIPAVLVALLGAGWLQVAEVVGILVAVNQLEGHLISPRLVGHTTRLTPLVIIFALLLGGIAYGLAGLVLAVPLAGVLRVLVDHFVPAYPVDVAADVQPGLTQEAKVETEQGS